ncbi:helix-turn-helix domain-containing protein [Desulfosporosinus lacus]|uniref:Helix-turn-helix domain-containing protein n=1 Tax=Desulfosporosinus lacus DSM 15449 TaxID=1121420 RepID=A0A1M5V6Z4_9FIRM|nr:helix-turn-helix domain-containing protein [Desulfosporosinus lacus]SHH70703.1 Helix-turn-helix domain-containing protein [Desulfosporosinus lacus DSM 15449]
MMNNKFMHTSLLPFPVIKMAADGNVDAINAVLKHYEGYLAALSTKRLYDENGNPHLCLDEELKRRLETKLITKILNFRVA